MFEGNTDRRTFVGSFETLFLWGTRAVLQYAG